MSDRVTIGSFRVVFRLERRLFSIGTWRIPVPFGVPLLGVAYGSLVLLVVLALGRVPLVGEILSHVPAPFRYLALPAGVAWLLVRLQPDGRGPHRVVRSWVSWRVRRRRTCAARNCPRPGTRIRLCDVDIEGLSGANLPRATLRPTAPMGVAIEYQCEAWLVRGALHLRQTDEAPAAVRTLVRIEPGQRVVFHGCA